MTDPWIPDKYLGYTGKDIINHKSRDCTSEAEWTHIWGGRYCEKCWPCTDEATKSPVGRTNLTSV